MVFFWFLTRDGPVHTIPAHCGGVFEGALELKDGGQVWRTTMGKGRYAEKKELKGSPNPRLHLSLPFVRLTLFNFLACHENHYVSQITLVLVRNPKPLFQLEGKRNKCQL